MKPSLILPWDVEWKQWEEKERYSGYKELNVRLAPDLKVVDVNLMTDVFNDGSDTFAIEFGIESGEEHTGSSDDKLSAWESKVMNDILALNPAYEAEQGEWDRESGETEWSSKVILVKR